VWFKAKMVCVLTGLALSSGCTVGSDLTGKHFSCASVEDCFDGTYCEPTLGICVHPDEDIKSFLDYKQSDASVQEGAPEVVAQDPGMGNADANPTDAESDIQGGGVGTMDGSQD